MIEVVDVSTIKGAPAPVASVSGCQTVTPPTVNRRESATTYSMSSTLLCCVCVKATPERQLQCRASVRRGAGSCAVQVSVSTSKLLGSRRPVPGWYRRKVPVRCAATSIGTRDGTAVHCAETSSGTFHVSFCFTIRSAFVQSRKSEVCHQSTMHLTPCQVTPWTVLDSASLS